MSEPPQFPRHGRDDSPHPRNSARGTRIAPSASMSIQPPEEDERISKRVVYEHETSSRQNKGAIIAITLIALATIVFIVMQLHH